MAEKNKIGKITSGSDILSSEQIKSSAAGEINSVEGSAFLSNQKSDLTPLMNQYHSVKSSYPDYIVFFRLGDFYEMFGEDAIIASPILNVVLTKRQNVPMCGVPHHSAANYIRMLLGAGRKVAICEQTGDIAGRAAGSTATAGSKKLITREVVRLITPGTVWEENLLDVRRNNYILSVIFSSQKEGDSVGIAAADISSADCFLKEVSLSNLAAEITMTNAKEIIVPESQKTLAENFLADTLLLSSRAGESKNITVSTMPDWHFDEKRALATMSAAAGVKTWDSIDPPDGSSRPTSRRRRGGGDGEGHILARKSMGGLLSYLEYIKFEGLENIISRAHFKRNEDFLYISRIAMRSLEILAPVKRDSYAEGATLVEILDRTITPMGSRQLVSFITTPLTVADEINRRLDAVEYFAGNHSLRRQLRESLKSISDIERILTRINTRSASPREIFHLGASLKKALSLKKVFSDLSLKENAGMLAADVYPAMIKEILNTLSSQENNLIQTITLIEKAIDPEGGGETGFIKAGYSKELDDIKRFSDGARQTILEIEQREKERTGISSLKIGYTSVFGYYIEIRKPNLSANKNLPPDYTRKQTLANAERFVIPELTELENRILHASENISAIEKEILSMIREKIRADSASILKIAKAVALIDTLSNLAEVAVENDWTRPAIISPDDNNNEDNPIEIKGLRHPVVEKFVGKSKFVPNDVHLSNRENQILLVTGPNMGGKSTYLRQTAICIILAQSGSFVPATKARISIVDRIFTRIGTSDNLASGESTFMTEMMETASIMREMTPRSLIILDEVGRGTSTFDGISIAWAIVEYLHHRGDEPPGGPKVLFATHYFELTELAEKLPRVKNFHVSAAEWKNEVVFLYKIEPGAADRSYGIHVAKLAGMPLPIVERSRGILSELESSSHHLLKIRSQGSDGKNPANEQMDFEDFMIFDKLKNIDVNRLTPIDALNILSDISEKIKLKKT